MRPLRDVSQEFAGKAALLLAGAALALGISEGILRLRYPRMVGAYQGLYVSSPEIGYKMKPHLDVEYRTAEYTTQLQANALGFRDREHPVNPPAGTYRILVLGDSMVEALQVPLEQTFHNVLEARLNERALDHHYEVIAMGVGGFGLIQEYAAWRAYGRHFKPNLVMLVAVPNDIEPDLIGLASPPSDEEIASRVSARLGVLRSSPIQRFYRSFHLYFFLRNALSQLPQGQAVMDWGRTVVNGEGRKGNTEAEPWFHLIATGTLPDAQQPLWNGFLDLIASLNTEVRASGAEFLVLSAPYVEQVEVNRLSRRLVADGLDPSTAVPDRGDRLLQEGLQERGVPSLVVTDRLNRANGPCYFRYDRHWTTLGHQRVAEAILDRLATTPGVPHE